MSPSSVKSIASRLAYTSDYLFRADASRKLEQAAREWEMDQDELYKLRAEVASLTDQVRGGRRI